LRPGAILLEVVLSLAIFTFAATILYGGLSQSIHAVQKVRDRNRAMDLAVSTFSRVQMGQLAIVDAGPSPFDSDVPALDGWQWQVIVEPVSTAEPLDDQSALTVIVTSRQTATRCELTGIVRTPPLQDEDQAPEPRP
jgi:type II secretory pathway pseudopilin PulG